MIVLEAEVAQLEQPADQRAELVAGSLRLGRDAPVLAETVALEEAENGLGVADVDREEHGGATRAVVVAGSLAEPLGERLGGERRLLALAAELLDRHVARRVDLGARDHPGRAVLVPDPDVLHRQVEERVARLREHLQRRAGCRGTSSPA